MEFHESGAPGHAKRAVIHTVSAIPARGGTQNRHFHEIPLIFMKIHLFSLFTRIFMEIAFVQ